MYRIQNRFNQYQLQNLFTVDAHEYDEGDDDGVYSPTFFEKNVLLGLLLMSHFGHFEGILGPKPIWGRINCDFGQKLL